MIIRKLGDYENSFFSKSISYHSTKLVTITSEIDLFAQQSVVLKAIEALKRRHPFLCCKIRSYDSGDASGHFTNVFVHDKDESNVSNVKFIRLRGVTANEADAELLNQLLCEREVAKEFDCQSELLWRINFVDMQPNAQKTSNEAEFR